MDYSAGMTKKIALASALIHAPRLLVLDEPFEAVDPVSAANIRAILDGYVASGGTVIVSSHVMDLVQRMCDHVAVIAGGSAAGRRDRGRGPRRSLALRTGSWSWSGGRGQSRGWRGCAPPKAQAAHCCATASGAAAGRWWAHLRRAVRPGHASGMLIFALVMLGGREPLELRQDCSGPGRVRGHPRLGR